MKRASPERNIQIAIRSALTMLGVRSRHVPNAGKRSLVAGRMLKQEGMVAGFPDLICWDARGQVGFLEVKAAKGRLSDAQVDHIEGMERDQLRVAVVRSVDDAVAAVRGWGMAR